MRKKFSSWWQAALDLFFPGPNFCLFCGEEEAEAESICRKCLNFFTYFRQKDCCEKCGKFIEEGKICSDCLVHSRFFNGGRAAGPYEGLLREAITAFKFRGQRKIGEVLAVMMTEVLLADDRLRGVEVVVPVPLGEERRRERGYNQAEILAAGVAEKLFLPCYPQVLHRCRETLPQRELRKEERWHNVRDAFAVREVELVNGKVILLVDDVFTTGATADACSAVLLQAGAKEVWVLTAAAGWDKEGLG